MADTHYWLGVVSYAHVKIGVDEGIAQLNHGKRAPLTRMHQGDWIVYYSPRTSYPSGERLQAFTAIGQVTSAAPYPGTLPSGFQPYRHDIRYLPCQSVPIQDLLPELSFIPDKQHWGARLRFGQLAIPQSDFQLIANAMHADLSSAASSKDEASSTPVGADLSQPKDAPSIRAPIHRASSQEDTQ